MIPESEKEKVLGYLLGAVLGLLAIIVILAVLHFLPKAVTAEVQYNNMNGEAKYRAGQWLKEKTP